MSLLHQGQRNKQGGFGYLVHCLVIIIILTGSFFLLINTEAQASYKAKISDVDSQIYLPLVANRWPPPPPIIHDIDNYDNDGNYAVDWYEDPEKSQITIFWKKQNAHTFVMSSTILQLFIVGPILRGQHQKLANRLEHICIVYAVNTPLATGNLVK